MNRLAILKLHIFLTMPSKESASSLYGTPVIFNVVRHEYQRFGGPKPCTLAVLLWMLKRGQSVLDSLLTKTGEQMSISDADAASEDPWHLVRFLSYYNA